MTKIAKLDGQGRLVGTVRRKKPGEGDIPLPDDCDLPLDGSYAYQDGAFYPVHAMRQVAIADAPVSQEAVMRDIIQSLGGKAPPSAVVWADWYDRTLRGMDEGAE